MRSTTPATQQPSFYPEAVEAIREREYPSLKDTIYLDHAGTTVPSVSSISAFAERMTTNLYGNPHSASAAAQLSSRQADDARVRVLKLLNANPDQFDVIFVANATAGIKLVAEGMREYFGNGFSYRYLVDSHTSSVGVRELSEKGALALEDDASVDNFIDDLRQDTEANVALGPILFEYPAQSNMTGRRYPLAWCKRLRETELKKPGTRFSLLDAASYVATSPLDLGDAQSAPDFTVLSFYKIFGFPDLGALIIRKDSGFIFSKRRYFGGGTTDMITVPSVSDEKKNKQWHAKKTTVHEILEDGTLPIHSIVALHAAMDSHELLYGSMINVSRHTSWLSKLLRDRLVQLRHANGKPLVELYGNDDSSLGDSYTQGPIFTFNLRTMSGHWIGKSDVERTAAVKDIQLRTGTLCNPGAMSRALGLSPDEMQSNYEAGQRCGDDNDILSGKPTGAIRISLGAMSTVQDVEGFIAFLEEFYLEGEELRSQSDSSASMPTTPARTSDSSLSSLAPRFFVKKLCVYPIKSCGAFTVPAGTPWPVTAEGLAWDRTWCLIHQGTGAALNQKRYPKMALIKPFLDEKQNIMRVQLCEPAEGENELCPVTKTMDIALFDDDNAKSTTTLSACEVPSKTASRVCGENINLLVYSAPDVASFFSEFLGVPCTLAKFPGQHSYMRHARAEDLPGRNVQPDNDLSADQNPYQLRLSNESPMLLISQSSVNKVNEAMRMDKRELTLVSADVFRANIVVEERYDTSGQHPYIEDSWNEVCFNPPSPRKSQEQTETVALDVLGSCRRCQMVCINQSTAVRGQEPFATLAKTRKIDGRVLFGRHVGLSARVLRSMKGKLMISVGDEVSTR